VSISFKSLLAGPRAPATDDQLQAGEIADGLFSQLSAAGRAASGRPYVILNMASTADGRASIDGRSGPIGNRADRELFHALRTTVDGVMIGAQTLRTERYNRIVADERLRDLRERRGLEREALACLVSQSLVLAADIPLLADPAAHVVILTASEGALSQQCAARIDYLRVGVEGNLDIPGALARLRSEWKVQTLLCEGGPHLNAQLLAGGLVDELFLSLAPKLAGGAPPAHALRIVTGEDLDPPVELELLWVLESESNLFLRYGVRRS
jgi:riboflavin biosynthesis pyrimidine reductase